MLAVLFAASMGLAVSARQKLPYPYNDPAMNRLAVQMYMNNQAQQYGYPYGAYVSPYNYGNIYGGQYNPYYRGQYGSPYNPYYGVPGFNWLDFLR